MSAVVFMAGALVVQQSVRVDAAERRMAAEHAAHHSVSALESQRFVLRLGARRRGPDPAGDPELAVNARDAMPFGGTLTFATALVGRGGRPRVHPEAVDAGGARSRPLAGVASLAAGVIAARAGGHELHETTGQYDGTTANPDWLG